MKLVRTCGSCRLLNLLSAALVGALSSCSSLSTLHTARPLPPGEVEYVGALGVYTFEDSLDEDVHLPSLEFSARRGFTERMDAGIKLNGLVQVDVNYALYLSDTFALSVDPAVAAFHDSGSSVYYFWLPVLMDLMANDTTTLTLSSRYGYMDIDALGDSDDSFGVSASTSMYSIGLGLRHRFASGLTLLPEFALVFPEEDNADGDPIVSVTLGMLF